MLPSDSWEIQSLIHGLGHRPSVLGAAGEFYVREPCDSSILLRMQLPGGAPHSNTACLSVALTFTLCCVPRCPDVYQTVRRRRIPALGPVAGTDISS